MRTVAHATVGLSDRPVSELDAGIGNESGVNMNLAGINNSPAQRGPPRGSRSFTNVGTSEAVKYKLKLMLTAFYASKDKIHFP